MKKFFFMIAMVALSIAAFAQPTPNRLVVTMKNGEAVVETLRPIREEAQHIMKDKAYLETLCRDGAERASYIAEKTLRKVYRKVGLVART